MWSLIDTHGIAGNPAKGKRCRLRTYRRLQAWLVLESNNVYFASQLKKGKGRQDSSCTFVLNLIRRSPVQRSLGSLYHTSAERNGGRKKNEMSGLVHRIVPSHLLPISLLCFQTRDPNEFGRRYVNTNAFNQVSAI